MIKTKIFKMKIKLFKWKIFIYYVRTRHFRYDGSRASLAPFKWFIPVDDLLIWISNKIPNIFVIHNSSSGGYRIFTSFYLNNERRDPHQIYTRYYWLQGQHTSKKMLLEFAKKVDFLSALPSQKNRFFRSKSCVFFLWF